jgi:hypothetical protein
VKSQCLSGDAVHDPYFRCTLAFAVEQRKNHGKPSVRVAEKVLRKTVQVTIGLVGMAGTLRAASTCLLTFINPEVSGCPIVSIFEDQAVRLNVV